MARHFRIHPSIGVARVGDSPDAFFIGPEQPDVPANWQNGAFDHFRDGAGRVKRQGARFRVFEYFPDEQGRLASPREISVGGDIADIEWRVHLANRKGSFFTFNGQSGADDLYLKRSHSDPRGVEKLGDEDDPQRLNVRNADIVDNPPGERARQLDIDTAEQMISVARAPDRVLLENTNPNTRKQIADLGELRLDGGRLIVLGGHGTSTSTRQPPVEINEYANNDTWLDDVSDGSVKARIVLGDGSTADADAAWVVVGPPDFAPGIGNVVSLYETMWDLGVRDLEIPTNALFQLAPLNALVEQKRVWNASGQQSLQGYVPSFTDEIYPILVRAFRARWTFTAGEAHQDLHFQLTELSNLCAENAEGSGARKFIQSWIRDPKVESLPEDDWRKMPRGLGDDYDDLHDEARRKRTSLLNLTQIQYALLEQWWNGNFKADWPAVQGDNELDVPAPAGVTPQGLDRAALENCVGGPFYPGIEVGWLMREKSLYREPFRLDVPSRPEAETEDPKKIGEVLTFRPGFFSQQMAQPWQADFYDCHKERHRSPQNVPYTFMWWTAQRPDDVFPNGSSADKALRNRKPWVQRFVPAGQDQDDFENTNERFSQMQSRWKELRFIVGDRNWFEEEPEHDA